MQREKEGKKGREKRYNYFWLGEKEGSANMHMVAIIPDWFAIIDTGELSLHGSEAVQKDICVEIKNE